MKRSTFITWDQLKVGVVILISILILTVAVYRLGQAANLFSSRYELVALMEAANGLREGGSVAVAGQIAGTVRKIEFLPVDTDTTRNLIVTISINESLREHVRENSTARLRTLGLLGDKIMDINPGTPPSPILQPGDTIPVSPSLDYEQVLAQASGAVDDMVQLTADLKEITGGLARGEGTVGQLLTNRTMYDELTQTLSGTNRLLARLQNPSGTFARMVDDPALYNTMVGTMQSLDSLLLVINSGQGTAGMLLRDTTLYANMVQIAERADSLMTMLTEGQGFVPSLLRDQQLYDQLNKVVTDLNAILEDVRRNPGRYMKGVVKVF